MILYKTDKLAGCVGYIKTTRDCIGMHFRAANLEPVHSSPSSNHKAAFQPFQYGLFHHFDFVSKCLLATTSLHVPSTNQVVPSSPRTATPSGTINNYDMGLRLALRAICPATDSDNDIGMQDLRRSCDVEHAYLGNAPGTTGVWRARYNLYLHILLTSRQFLIRIRVPHSTSRNSSQIKNSSRIGVYETFRSMSSTARLLGGIFQNIRNSKQRHCPTCQMTYGHNFKHL
ncbi:hypothetical protein TNCV_1097881 [Trichonephila clavipes]|nr:hypothetical protein TNCV_1097881 [Trichonephila clavipes]